MKDLYRSLCREEPSIPLFSRDWWLDAVCPEGCWHVVLVRKNGRVEASLPYLMERPGVLSMPPLTQCLGPWLRPRELSYPKLLSRQKKLMNELIDGLPPFEVFRQSFHYSIENWLPFHWRGFRETTRYTYVIDDLTDVERVWTSTSRSQKQETAKARKRNISVVSSKDLGVFLELQGKTYSRQGMKNPVSSQIVRAVHAAADKRNSSEVLLAVDERDRPHAGAFIVHTPKSAFYLMGGADPELRSSGAQYLLLWTAIERAANVSERFDFEGSMLEGVERSFRQFGARQRPYFAVWKDNRSNLQRAFDLSMKKARALKSRLGI